MRVIEGDKLSRKLFSEMVFSTCSGFVLLYILHFRLSFLEKNVIKGVGLKTVLRNSSWIKFVLLFGVFLTLIGGEIKFGPYKTIIRNSSFLMVCLFLSGEERVLSRRRSSIWETILKNSFFSSWVAFEPGFDILFLVLLDEGELEL